MNDNIKMHGFFLHPAVFERTQNEHCGNLTLPVYKLNDGERGLLLSFAP